MNRQTPAYSTVTQCTAVTHALTYTYTHIHPHVHNQPHVHVSSYTHCSPGPTVVLPAIPSFLGSAVDFDPGVPGKVSRGPTYILCLHVCERKHVQVCVRVCTGRTHQPPLERDGVDVELSDQAQVVVHVLQAAQHLEEAPGQVPTVLQVGSATRSHPSKSSKAMGSVPPDRTWGGRNYWWKSQGQGREGPRAGAEGSMGQSEVQPWALFHLTCSPHPPGSGKMCGLWGPPTLPIHYRGGGDSVRAASPRTDCLNQFWVWMPPWEGHKVESMSQLVTVVGGPQAAGARTG